MGGASSGCRERARRFRAWYSVGVRLAVVVLLASCGAPPPRPPISHAVAPGAEQVRQFRQLMAGKLPAHAKRTTFALAFDGDRATLTETEEQAPRSLSIEDADREAAWTARSTRTYRGTRRAAGNAIDLDLATADMQPLHLHCVDQSVQVAAAGARRVRSPNRGADDECGDRGVFEPAATTPMRALVCSAAGQPSDDADDDDRLVFAPAPGIEWAFQNDDCALQGGGLRRAR